MILQAGGDLRRPVMCWPRLRLTLAVETRKGWEAVGTWLGTVLESQLYRSEGDEFCSQFQGRDKGSQGEAPSQDKY